MNMRALTERKPAAAFAASRTMPAFSAVLQRKCACGGSGGGAGECEECKRRNKLQRHPGDGGAGEAARGLAPPIVHDVLRSPGQSLDAATRAFFEPRFGYDFSKVRIHADEKAAQSARAIEASAYAVGEHITFASGRYAPGTAEGSRLLAHELTHVVQQGPALSNPAAQLSIESSHSDAEREAAQVESSISNSHGVIVAAKASEAIHRAPDAPPPAANPGAVGNCKLPSDYASEHEAGMEMMCVSDASKKGAKSCTLTDGHLKILNDGKNDAKLRVGKAYARIYMVGGPEYAERVARKIFTDGPPSTEIIKRTLENTLNVLQGNGIQFAGGTCADPACEGPGQHAAAYESGKGKPVVFCPRSFLPSFLPELRRTMIHEALHLAGVDIDPNTDELYCRSYSCEEKCQSTATADAWSLFIDCFGGALPAATPSSGQGQAPGPSAAPSPGQP